MDDGKRDKYECAADMLRLINSGRSPRGVRQEMKRLGYTPEEVAEASQVLIDAY